MLPVELCDKCDCLMQTTFDLVAEDEDELGELRMLWKTPVKFVK